MIFLKMTSIFSCIAFIQLSVNAQNLTPNELKYFNQLTNDSIRRDYLEQKGYNYNQTVSYTRTNEKRESWIFKISQPETTIISHLIKWTDSNHKSKVILTLYHPFHYQQFLDQLLADNFDFKGARIMQNQNYLHFKKHDHNFYTKEGIGASDTVYFEIVLETGKVNVNSFPYLAY